MKSGKALKIALNIIFHSKLRSWLTIIGIVIGVAAIIAIVSIGNGFQKDIQEQLGGLGSDTININSGFDRASQCPGPQCRSRPGETPQTASISPLTNREVQAIRSIPDISAIDTLVDGKTEAYYLGETASINIEGVDTQVWNKMTSSTLAEGRFLNPGDANAVVVGNVIAKEVFKQQVSLNRVISINKKPFRVVGILKASSGFGVDDRKIFMPFSNARDILEKPEKTYDALVVKVRDQNNIDAVEQEIEQRLMIVRRVTTDTKDFTVISMKTIQERVNAILQGFTIFLGAIAAVSLIVGSVGIANTMFTSVLERTKEIGIMKAVGAKNADIIVIYLLNSGLVGLVGGILGVCMGVGIAILIPKLGVSLAAGGRPLTTDVSTSLILFTLFFSMILGMIAGAIPAYRASRLKPVEALRFE